MYLSCERKKIADNKTKMCAEYNISFLNNSPFHRRPFLWSMLLHSHKTLKVEADQSMDRLLDILNRLEPNVPALQEVARYDVPILSDWRNASQIPKKILQVRIRECSCSNELHIQLRLLATVLVTQEQTLPLSFHVVVLKRNMKIPIRHINKPSLKKKPISQIYPLIHILIDAT